MNLIRVSVEWVEKSARTILRGGFTTWFSTNYAAQERNPTERKGTPDLCSVGFTSAVNISGLWDHSGFLPTSVIQGRFPPLYEQHSLWEALSVVSQWSFPTALVKWLDFTDGQARARRPM